jgi:hypothetical protein
VSALDVISKPLAKQVTWARNKSCEKILARIVKRMIDELGAE